MTLQADELSMLLETIESFANRALPLGRRLDLDMRHEYPADVLQGLFSELGIHLLFVPTEYGGMGAGAYEIYRVSETMARIDLGVATAVLATFLGTDPIVVGGTEAQRDYWLGRIASEAPVVAYAVTEPTAGSDLSAIKTTARRIEQNSRITGYELNGEKQFITNGGVADLTTVLAMAPDGPSFFIVERGAPGFEPGKAEAKHGICASNTTSISIDGVRLGADRLIGEREGQGLVQAQQVFGYTRLMVAAFGLGAGRAAMERAIAYARERVQGGGPLAAKQAYTHKLLVPQLAALQAARAYIEQTARRIDANPADVASMQTQGAIAKLVATEAGRAAADAAVQAHGGNGYMREYEVEKIARDVRITTIYEGTSEILQWTIGRDHWQQHLKSRGQVWSELARAMRQIHEQQPSVGAGCVADAYQALGAMMQCCQQRRLTRHQHILFRMGDICARVEAAAAPCRWASNEQNGPAAEAGPTNTLARIYARDTLGHVVHEAMRRLCGASADLVPSELAERLGACAMWQAYDGLVEDMDRAARAACA